MKVLILSDSHNNKKNLDSIVPIIRDEIDLIIHAGDNFRDSVYLSKNTNKPVFSVVGNCDMENLEEELVFEVEGHMFFLTHGHKYGVKYGLDRIVSVGMENGADIVIFGHTHIKESKKISNMEVINPGSLSLPRDGYEKSYVIMDIDKNGYKYDYVLF